jgi:hypothetical protein
MQGRKVLSIVFLLAGTTMSHAAVTKPAVPKVDYRAIMVECRKMYWGLRSPSVDASRPTLIEGCFRQRTGKHPWQAGVTVYPTTISSGMPRKPVIR